MKPRILASVGAVLLYLWCEFFQASPFVFLQQGRVMAERSTQRAPATQMEGSSNNALRELFSPTRLER